MTNDHLDFKNKVLKQYKANLDSVESEFFDRNYGSPQEFCLGFHGTHPKRKKIQSIAIEWTIDDFSEIIRQIVLDSPLDGKQVLVLRLGQERSQQSAGIYHVTP